MKIGFILGHKRPSSRSWLRQVIGLLRSWGGTVDEIYPGRDMIDLSKVCIEHDLYVLKPSGSDLSLSYAGLLHGLGARILNSYPVTATLRDKVLTTQKIQRAGIPVPYTVAVLTAKHVHELLDTGPLIVKPYRGHLGQGVRLIRSPDDIRPLGGVHLAQHYHPPDADGLDRKIYSIGGHIYGVLRKFPAKTYEEKKGTPFTVGPELLGLTKRCGDVFGIDTFGVDIIISDGKPYVVDMSAFPGFKGVPNAATRIADYLSSHLTLKRPPAGTTQTGTRL
ncbi:MAG: hypothetical protein L3K24_03225 [Gammaproteobacteria bacterium]|nr:hypothetical protein [Gammaproteobacteria bacterium]